MLKTARKQLIKSKLGVHVIPGFATLEDINIAIGEGVDIFRIASHCTEADVTQKHIDYIRKNKRKSFWCSNDESYGIKETLFLEAKMINYGAQSIILIGLSWRLHSAECK